MAAKANQKVQSGGDSIDDNQDGDKSKVVSKKELEKDAPIYREEDILGLKLEGTNVYAGEKKALLNVIKELLMD